MILTKNNWRALLICFVMLSPLSALAQRLEAGYEWNSSFWSKYRIGIKTNNDLLSAGVSLHLNRFSDVILEHGAYYVNPNLHAFSWWQHFGGYLTIRKSIVTRDWLSAGLRGGYSYHHLGRELKMTTGHTVEVNGEPYADIRYITCNPSDIHAFEVGIECKARLYDNLWFGISGLIGKTIEKDLFWTVRDWPSMANPSYSRMSGWTFLTHGFSVQFTYLLGDQ